MRTPLAIRVSPKHKGRAHREVNAPSAFKPPLSLRPAAWRGSPLCGAYCGILQVAAVVQLGVPEPACAVSMSQVTRFIATPTGNDGSNSELTGFEVLLALFDAATNCGAQTPAQPLARPRQVFLSVVVVEVLQRQGVPSSNAADSP